MTLTDLSSTQWELVSYRTANGEVLASSVDEHQKATLQFDSEGKIGGHSECNTFGGDATMKNGTLQASLFATKRYCKEVAEQENTIMTVFNEGATLGKNGDQLVLTNGDRQLVYRPATGKVKSLAVETSPQPKEYEKTIEVEPKEELSKAPEEAVTKQLTESNRFVGLFRYMADAAVFTSCTDDKRYAVELSGAFVECEKAYSSMNKSGEPAFMVLDGEVVKNQGEGPKEILRITKLISANTTTKCK